MCWGQFKLYGKAQVPPSGVAITHTTYDAALQVVTQVTTQDVMHDVMRRRSS